jgi:hypothetical protein
LRKKREFRNFGKKKNSDVRSKRQKLRGADTRSN